jgi:hypothetical protein
MPVQIVMGLRMHDIGVGRKLLAMSVVVRG